MHHKVQLLSYPYGDAKEAEKQIAAPALVTFKARDTIRGGTAGGGEGVKLNTFATLSNHQQNP